MGVREGIAAAHPPAGLGSECSERELEDLALDLSGKPASAA